MTSSLHPVIIIFAGALLVGVLKGKLKGVVSVLTPVIGLINLILIDRSHGGNYVMTLSLMDWKPQILEPSKPRPSSKTSSFKHDIGVEKWCHVPGKSQNL